MRKYAYALLIAGNAQQGAETWIGADRGLLLIGSLVAPSRVNPAEPASEILTRNVFPAATPSGHDAAHRTGFPTPLATFARIDLTLTQSIAPQVDTNRDGECQIYTSKHTGNQGWRVQSLCSAVMCAALQFEIQS